MSTVLAPKSCSQCYICSPMNYIGGKYKLLLQLLPQFPRKISTFVDLFCGGANVGINVNAEHLLLNDNITPLIDLYRSLQRLSIDEILTHVHNRISEYDLSLTNAEGYLSLRQLYNQTRNPLDLFVLTAYSFNHQIRFNNAHEFNNPFGKERSCFNSRMKSNLIAFVEALHKKSVSFSSSNFEDVDLSSLGENDFVYCDPPYLITTGTYNDGKRGFTGWNEVQEYKLLALLDKLNNKKVPFALSNVLIHKGKKNSILCDWIQKNNYTVIHFTKDYSNSNYHTLDRNKASTDEALIINYVSEAWTQQTFEDALYW